MCLLKYSQRKSLEQEHPRRARAARAQGLMAGIAALGSLAKCHPPQQHHPSLETVLGFL